MVVSIQQLNNASTDVETIELVVNGAPDRPNPGKPDGTVTTRLGRVIRTLSSVMDRVFNLETTAEAAAQRADIAASSAEAFVGPTYLSVESGLSATEDEGNFAVNVNGVVTIYKKVNNNAVYQRDAVTAAGLPNGINNYLLSSIIKEVAKQLKVKTENGTYYLSPSYQSPLEDTALVGLSGSKDVPTSSSSAAGYFSKVSTNHAFNALVGVAHKYGNQYEDRATAVFGQAVDYVGVYGSFVEGGRFEGTLINGNQGAAYGAICSAGVDPNTGATDPRLLVGCEADVNDQLGPDAPLFGAFNRDRFRTTFLASQGVGVGGNYKVDAAFVCNPYSLGKFQTGFLLTECIVDTGIAATSGTAMAKGIDLSLADLSYATLVAPNNAPIRFRSADGLVDINVINVTSDNNIQIGQSGIGKAIFTTIPYSAIGKFQMQSIPFSNLPPPTQEYDGTIAFVGDAASPVTAWNQVVTAGGGVNPAYVKCIGGAWRAI